MGCKLPHPSDTVCTDCAREPSRVAWNHLLSVRRELIAERDRVEEKIENLDQTLDLLQGRM